MSLDKLAGTSLKLQGTSLLVMHIIYMIDLCIDRRGRYRGDSQLILFFQ